MLQAADQANQVRETLDAQEGILTPLSVEIEMEATRPLHMISDPDICQEQVEQPSSWLVLKDSMMQADLTVAEQVHLQTGIVFGVTGDTDLTAIAAPIAAPLALSPQAETALAAGDKRMTILLSFASFISNLLSLSVQTVRVV